MQNLSSVAKALYVILGSLVVVLLNHFAFQPTPEILASIDVLVVSLAVWIAYKIEPGVSAKSRPYN